MLLNDISIKNLCDPELVEKVMLSPFLSEKVKIVNGVKIPSKGLSSFGYDISLSDDFKIPTGDIFDSHNVESMTYRDVVSDYIEIKPQFMVLARSVEYFQMPENVLGFCEGKSTLARMGLCVNTTPIEPNWSGYLTLELSNIGHIPIRLHKNDGIAQIVFFTGQKPNTTYDGKYQNQMSILGAIN